MPPPATHAARTAWLASVIVIGLVVVLLAQTVTVGADAMWLVAMGRAILREGGIPVGVPFAAADSSGWVNVPVLGELVFLGAHSVGPLGLPALQLAVDVAFLVLMTLAAHKLGARGVPSAVVVLVAAIGMLPALGVVRAQLLSLIPFVLLLLLLRSEHERPSRRIWFLVPLVALWGNLHGAALAGVAVAGCYFLLSRLPRRPLETIAVGVATVMALWATPAHLRTAHYYFGVFSNEAARRGSDLWAGPRLDQALDVLMVLGALALGGLALARRRPAWEYVALAGLAMATWTAARHGIWLLLFASGPAAIGLSRLMPPRSLGHGVTTAGRDTLTRAAALAFLLIASATLWTRATEMSADARRVAAVSRVVGHDVVLAPEPLAESLAAEGVLVWMCNPIDAFSQADQAAFLDFASGQGRDAARALDAVDLVVAESGSMQSRLATQSGFTVKARVDDLDIMHRADPG
jgi:hypothetical protein